MSDDAPPDVQQALDEQIAELCRGIAHTHRIAILRGIRQDHALTAVADALDLSRSGVQTHVDTLVDTGLVVRTGDQQDPYYVTVRGELALQLVAQVQPAVQRIEDARQTAEDQAADELGDTPLPEAERDRAINRRTWELVEAALADEDWAFSPS
jgi:DNA-binding MarR family transcriptional regulator